MAAPQRGAQQRYEIPLPRPSQLGQLPQQPAAAQVHLTGPDAGHQGRCLRTWSPQSRTGTGNGRRGLGSGRHAGRSSGNTRCRVQRAHRDPAELPARRRRRGPLHALRAASPGTPMGRSAPDPRGHGQPGRHAQHRLQGRNGHEQARFPPGRDSPGRALHGGFGQDAPRNAHLPPVCRR